MRRAFAWRESAHPFAQRLVPSPDGASLFRSPAAGALHALVADHVVRARVIFPGAGYLELARAACCAAAASAPQAALRGVFFLRPLATATPGLHVECAVADGRFEVRSGEVGGGASLVEPAAHCSGACAAAAAAGRRRVEHASARGRLCALAAAVGALYDGFDAAGLQYGPGYRTLEQAWGGGGAAAARLRARSTQQGTRVHPADLDDALCTGALASGGAGGGTQLPFAVDDALLQGGGGELWAVRRHRP